MEGFLFLLDMVLLIFLMAAVIKAEQASKSLIDSGLFAFRREATKSEGIDRDSQDA
jgi:hypothetical protein